ncbi:MAG: hypothetical protein AMXMBFR84_48600 [Candidatus Hydrogenedentota bacterium]
MQTMARTKWIGAFVTLLALSLSVAAHAQDILSGKAVSYICVVADSGLPIVEYNPDEVRAPASMVKLIQMLMVSEGLREGIFTLEQEITVTAKAAGIGGTQVFLKEGEVHTLEKLMQAVSINSANDAAMAVAEGLWGDEDTYKKAANERALALGMTSTVVNSVHGLPPDPGNEHDKTTARDMVILAQACIREPLIREWTSMKELTFRVGEDPKPNTNKLLFRMAECDGLKTGYTRAAGYCLTATAEINGIRVIGVVMGCNRLADRFDSMETLLKYSATQVGPVTLVAKGQPIEPSVGIGNGKMESMQLHAANDIIAILPASAVGKVQFFSDYPDFLWAPIAQGHAVGTLNAQLGETVLGSTEVIVPEAVEEPDWRWKLGRGLLRTLGRTASGG